MLPSNEKNVVGKAKVDKTVMSSDDWKSAKEDNDMNAAGRVIDNVWPDKKTELIRVSVKDPKNVIFITQPTSSGTNAVPIALAQRLSQNLKADFIVGDLYFNARHKQQSKNIPQHRRMFEKRKFRSVDIEGLKEQISGKKIIVVEDILTTGGSVADFTHHLKNEGIQVESIIALMGDKRLQIDTKTFDKLDQAIKNKSLPINTPELSQQITRAEAGLLIRSINSVRTENARDKLTRNLQGILDKRIVKDMGRDQITKGYEQPGGTDRCNAGIAERVQTWHLRDKAKLIPYESQKDNFLNSLNKQKTKTQVKNKVLAKNISKEIEY